MDIRMIRQVIRSRRQELVELAASFIRIPSENPSTEFKKHSAEMGQSISRYLAARGFFITEYPNSKSGLVTVVCDAPLTKVSGPRLLFCGHTDVVPAGDRSKWTFEPYSGEVRTGMLLGRGSSDMKGGLASQVFVAGLLQQFASTLNLKGTLGVIASPDEETGGIEVSSLLDRGLIKGDACLIGEPTHPCHPNVGEKAMAWMRVTVPGQPGHGSQQPLSGISAVRKGADVIEALSKLWMLKATPPEELKQLVYNTEWFISHRLGNPFMSQLLYRPSYNPGIIQGGSKVNMIADECIIEVDTRVPFGMKSEFLQAAANNLVKAVTPDAVVEQMLPTNNPNWTLENRPIVRSLELGIQRVLGMGQPVFSVLSLGSSDACHFRRNGIDTVFYGPGLQSTIHGYDEQVSVESLVQSAEIYAETAIMYLRSL
ncbi:ArgE/DapE family deacylase [Sporosarcina sp. ACRSL]|uniref:M20 family metallopeptidase n=1 Tax=Sporosarcina sp. ACRSL TaxID=2918215 RepID=UPI001EF4A6B8|nr:ArgE/DapE family deacylase [Sporosarcina sp. ACRSL]MCG7343559.1 ArgE/DapE family deacylase [Sporosarcina sp. ACRSL]